MSSKQAIKTNNSINTSTPAASNTFDCSCGKQYKHRQTLLNHQKKCNAAENEEDNSNQFQYVDENNVPITNEMLNQLINENKQLKLILLAYIKTLKDLKAMAEAQQRNRNENMQYEHDEEEDEQDDDEEQEQEANEQQ
jgi:hypothetical protein